MTKVDIGYLKKLFGEFELRTTELCEKHERELAISNGKVNAVMKKYHKMVSEYEDKVKLLEEELKSCQKNNCDTLYVVSNRMSPKADPTRKYTSMKEMCEKEGIREKFVLENIDKGVYSFIPSVRSELVVSIIKIT